MPQPLSRLPHVKCTVYGIDACDARPEHMHAVMKIIAAAAFSDQWLGNVLVSLDPKRAVRLARHLNSLENDAKKSASFEATASALLDEDKHDLLKKIVAKHRSAMKLRQPFAHHRYGWSDDDKDLLILIDPRDELLDRAHREELNARPPTGEEKTKKWFAEMNASNQAFKDSVMTYRLQELENIRKEIELATQCLTQFWQIISARFPPHAIADISAQLAQNLEKKA